MNIATGKGVFIHYYFKSVLLLWTKHCLLFRWVVSVYLIAKQIFFFSLQCASSFFFPPQFCVPPMPLVMVHNHWCISDDVIIVHLLFCCVGFIQFYEPQNESLKQKRKGNSVRCFNSQDSLTLCQGEVLSGLGNTWSSGNHLFHFLTSHVAHPTLNELLARS